MRSSALATYSEMLGSGTPSWNTIDPRDSSFVPRAGRRAIDTCRVIVPGRPRVFSVGPSTAIPYAAHTRAASSATAVSIDRAAPASNVSPMCRRGLATGDASARARKKVVNRIPYLFRRSPTLFFLERERARTANSEGDQAREVHEIHFVPRRAKAWPRGRDLDEFDRAEPVRQVHAQRCDDHHDRQRADRETHPSTQENSSAPNQLDANRRQRHGRWKGHAQCVKHCRKRARAA